MSLFLTYTGRRFQSCGPEVEGNLEVGAGAALLSYGVWPIFKSARLWVHVCTQECSVYGH